jgi:hypothetical protein
MGINTRDSTVFWFCKVSTQQVLRAYYSSIYCELVGINASIMVERQFLKLEAFKVMMVTDGANCHLVFSEKEGKFIPQNLN